MIADICYARFNCADVVRCRVLYAFAGPCSVQCYWHYYLSLTSFILGFFSNFVSSHHYSAEVVAAAAGVCGMDDVCSSADSLLSPNL